MENTLADLIKLKKYYKAIEATYTGGCMLESQAKATKKIEEISRAIDAYSNSLLVKLFTENITNIK